MFSRSATRLRMGRALLGLGLVSGILYGGPAWGQTSPVICIEQDWEMFMGEPDPKNNAPQVLCVISPTRDSQSVYAVLELNHQSLPQYAAGGMQFQLWRGEELQREVNAANGYQLETAGEVIRWTQRMTLAAGQLEFAIVDGRSNTWGDFGDGLRLTVAAPVADLSAYSTDFSTENSGVGFAPNRVHTLILKRIRWIQADGRVTQDSGEKVVHNNYIGPG